MTFTQHTKQIGIVGYKCIKCRKLITVHYHTEDAGAFEYALQMARDDYDSHLDICGDKWREGNKNER